MKNEYIVYALRWVCSHCLIQFTNKMSSAQQCAFSAYTTKRAQMENISYNFHCFSSAVRLLWLRLCTCVERKCSVKIKLFGEKLLYRVVVSLRVVFFKSHFYWSIFYCCHRLIHTISSISIGEMARTIVVIRFDLKFYFRRRAKVNGNRIRSSSNVVLLSPANKLELVCENVNIKSSRRMKWMWWYAFGSS